MNFFRQRLNLHWIALKFKNCDDVMSDHPVESRMKKPLVRYCAISVISLEAFRVPDYNCRFDGNESLCHTSSTSSIALTLCGLSFKFNGTYPVHHTDCSFEGNFASSTLGYYCTLPGWPNWRIAHGCHCTGWRKLSQTNKQTYWRKLKCHLKKQTNWIAASITYHGRGCQNIQIQIKLNFKKITR